MRRHRRRTRRAVIVGLLLGLVVFALLRTVHALAEPPSSSDVGTAKLVVVGTTARYEPTAGDRQLLDDQADEAQFGAVAVRPRYVGDCAAAGWTTLGAGRRAAVSPSQGELNGPLCAAPAITATGKGAGGVADWADRLVAARANAGDARLGTVAGSGSRCVAAVGPYAALAAARPDGSLTSYRTLAQYVHQKYVSPCPLTFVDAGPDDDALLAALAAQPDTTVIMTGVGPAPGSTDPGVQLIYRIGTTLPGIMTSDSTRRDGVVTLTDLTRTLVDFVQADDTMKSAVAVDGSAVGVQDATVSGSAAAANLRAVTALSDAVLVGYTTLGVGGAIVVLGIATLALRGRFAASRALLVMGAGLSASMMLVGAYPWAETAHPAAVLSVTVWIWATALAGLALIAARRTGAPLAIAAAFWTAVAFTVDAALGTPMQAGSMLNSRPIFALRWYGFGNVTFAAYAAAALLVAGYLAGRAAEHHHRRRAVAIVLGIGFFVILCEGWPTMGTDFGGVVALTPPVLWLALRVSGRRVTAARLAIIAGAAVVAIGAISALDWLRPAAQRSHLGNFVQRVLDGDAGDVVIRKAVASAGTLVSLMGVLSLLLGIALWVLMLRVLIPRVAGFARLRDVAWAALATAILGVLVNDGGISVFIMLTGAFAVSVGCLYLDRCVATGSLRPDRVA